MLEQEWTINFLEGNFQKAAYSGGPYLLMVTEASIGSS